MKIRSKRTTSEDPSIPTRSGFEGMHVWWLLSKDSAGITGAVGAVAEIAPEIAHGLHRHDGYREVLYIEEGNGLFFTDSEIQRIQPGDMVTFEPGEWHAYVNDRASLTRLISFYSADNYEDIPYEEWVDWRPKYEELRHNVEG